MLNKLSSLHFFYRRIAPAFLVAVCWTHSNCWVIPSYTAAQSCG